MLKILELRPPRIAMVLLLLTFFLWHLSPKGTVLHFDYRLIGSSCIVTGLALNIWAWLLFKKANTAVCSTEESSSLVVTGIFRLTRNPMYLGMLLVLMGAAFFMGTIPSLFAPAVFFLIIDKIFIPFEEEKLHREFGLQYSEYVRRTRRWV